MPPSTTWQTTSILLYDLQAQQASIHQQDVPNADIVDEAIIVDGNAAILAVRSLLDCEDVLFPCTHTHVVCMPEYL